MTISVEGHSGVTLRNLVNIFTTKKRLIVKATGVDVQPIIARAMTGTINSARLKTIDDFLKLSAVRVLQALRLQKTI